MSVKSETCVGKKTGRPLTEYGSQQEAQEGADHANENFQRNLVPYRCNRCSMWHLSPANRQTPSSKCTSCTGAEGKPKDAYQSREDAERRAGILRKEQGVSLQVYQCEYGNGWHLARTPRR